MGDKYKRGKFDDYAAELISDGAAVVDLLSERWQSFVEILVILPLAVLGLGSRLLRTVARRPPLAEGGGDGHF